jgi:SagB-type dehydrogenase family enzyme
MITADQQDKHTRKTITTELSPTVAYVQWLLDAFDSGCWSADLTRPRLLYKVYRDVRRLPLDHRFPLRLGSSRTAFVATDVAKSTATLAQALAWTLYYSHGLTRILRPAPGSVQTSHAPGDETTSDPILPASITGPKPSYQLAIGRPVPSGGSLHGTELYLAVGSTLHLPAGIYHYDCVHHALELLRPGNYLAELAACLPEANDLTSCPAVLLPAAFFQKNHQKYTNLSYRLQMLDMGVVVEQLLFIGRHFGLDGSLALQFLDRPVHHLLGIDIREENVYAVLPLHAPDTAPSPPKYRHPAPIDELPPVTATHIQPFTPEPRSALLDRLYTAALLDHLPDTPTTLPPLADRLDPADCIALPQANFPATTDLADVLLRRRRTSFNAIDTRPMAMSDLANVLAYAAGCAPDSQIYCAITRVTGVPAGTYRYHSLHHALVTVNPASPTSLLRCLALAPNIQLHLAPVNIFLAGDFLQAHQRFGERGLRLLGIELGRVTQRLSLAAAALNLAVHIHFSYRIGPTAEQLLQLPTLSHLPLISLMLGYPRTSQEGLLEVAW